MSTLQCIVDNNTIRLVNYPTLVAGSVGVDSVDVYFDDSWPTQDASHKIIFYNDSTPENKITKPLLPIAESNGDVAVDDYLGGCRCVIPSDALVRPGMLIFGLVAEGSDGTIIKVTNTIKHPIVGGPIDDGNVPSETSGDFQIFRNGTIDRLNDSGFELTGASSNVDIFSAIEALADRASLDPEEESRTWFIELWNQGIVNKVEHDAALAASQGNAWAGEPAMYGHIFPHMDSSMSNEQIRNVIDTTFTRIGLILYYWMSCQWKIGLMTTTERPINHPQTIGDWTDQDYLSTLDEISIYVSHLETMIRIQGGSE